WRRWPDGRRDRRAPRRDTWFARGDLLRRPPPARRARDGTAGGARDRRPALGATAAARPRRAPGAVEHRRAVARPRSGTPGAPRRPLVADVDRRARGRGHHTLR